MRDVLPAITLCLSPLLFAIAGCSGRPENSASTHQVPAQPLLQCAADTACKGDRICINGTCQAPPVRAASAAGPTSAAVTVGPTGEPNYAGVPSKDDAFASFIDQNVGKVVTLDVLTPDDAGESMPEGYRGGPPSFMGKPVSGTNRQYVIDCEAPDDPMLHSVEDCGKAVSWEPIRSRLKGRFRVAGVEKDPAFWLYTLKPEEP